MLGSAVDKDGRRDVVTSALDKFGRQRSLPSKAGFLLSLLDVAQNAFLGVGVDDGIDERTRPGGVSDCEGRAGGDPAGRGLRRGRPGRRRPGREGSPTVKAGQAERKRSTNLS